jgi:hypothetical protein
MKKYNFDPLCLDLASHFLADSAPEDAKNDLAQVIQDAVDAHRLKTDRPPLASFENRLQ